jgi:predicted Zn-dependent protease
MGEVMKRYAFAGLVLSAAFAFAPVADARERAQQSILARVKAGGYAEACRTAASAPQGEGSGLIDTAQGAPAVARMGVRVLPLAGATTNLRGILQRFQTVAAPPQGVTPALWIEDSAEIDARQRGGGDIYVTRGALDVLTAQSRQVPEQQIAADIAFVLAHEYAHLLLCHHNRVRTTQSISRGLDTLAQLGVAGQYLSQMQGGRAGLADQGRFNNGVAETMAAHSTLQMINSKLINPAWSRDQERDADFLAVELMAAAGAPTDFVPDLLASLKSADDSFSSQMTPVMQQMQRQMTSEVEQAARTGGNVDVGSMAQRLGRQAVAGALVSKVSHFHESPQQRAERVVAMMEFLGATDTSAFAGWAGPAARGLRGAAGGEFAAARLALEAHQKLSAKDVEGGCAAAQRALTMAPNYPSALVAAGNCAVARNDTARASQHFNRLTQSPFAIPEDFVLSSQVWAAARNRTNATRALDTGATRFGADPFYVPRMMTAASFSDTVGVNTARDQCTSSTRDANLRTQCTNFAAQLTGQPAQAQAPQTPAQQGADAVRQGLGGLLGRRN